MFIILAFLLGAVGGTFVGKSYFGKRDSFRHHPAREEVRKEFIKKLKLTPEQSVAVDSILEATRPKFSAIREQHTQLFQAQRDSLRKEIRTLLSQEQNLLYDRYIKEMEERESRWRRQGKP